MGCVHNHAIKGCVHNHAIMGCVCTTPDNLFGVHVLFSPIAANELTGGVSVPMSLPFVMELKLIKYHPLDLKSTKTILHQTHHSPELLESLHHKKSRSCHHEK